MAPKSKAKTKGGGKKVLNPKNLRALGAQSQSSKIGNFFEKLDDSGSSEENKLKECQKFISGLDSKTSQLLWKQFELSRRSEGCDEEFKKETSGAGSQGKKRMLLKSWMIDGGTTKGQSYKKAWVSISVSHTESCKSQWQPLQYMITKHGKAELAGLVESGAIKVRKKLKDNRYYEFREEVEGDEWAKTQTKGADAYTTQASDTQAFLNFARSDLRAIDGDDIWKWDQGEINKCDGTVRPY